MRANYVPFRAIPGTTIQLPATTTTSRVAIPATALPAVACRIVHSTGTDKVRWRNGSVTVNAVTLVDTPQLPGTVEVFGLNANDTHIAVITDSGSGTLEITFGMGY